MTPPELGFFCNSEPSACSQLQATSQILIWPNDSSLGCNSSVMPITQNGQPAGAYVDDTLGAAEASDQQCAQAEGLQTWAGLVVPASVPGYNWQTPILPLGISEWYPILTSSDAVPPIPPPGPGGYVLQAFSWQGSSLETCANGCDAPSFAQSHAMWCEALAQHPKAIFWFPATDASVPLDLQVEQTPC